jgi:hypothetical protein
MARPVGESITILRRTGLTTVLKTSTNLMCKKGTVPSTPLAVASVDGPRQQMTPKM